MLTLLRSKTDTEIYQLKLKSIEEALEAIRNVNRVASGNELRVGGETALWSEAYESMNELHRRVLNEL